jgi:hypothetical protein
MSKTWTYAELTQETERALIFWAEVASDARAGGESNGQSHNCRTRATGALDLWNRLTEGYSTVEDTKRLLALSKAVDPSPFDHG